MCYPLSVLTIMYRADTSDGRQVPKVMMMMQGMNYVERHVTEVPMDAEAGAREKRGLISCRLWRRNSRRWPLFFSW